MPRSRSPCWTRTSAETVVFWPERVGVRPEVGERVARHGRRLAAPQSHVAVRAVRRRRREHDRDEHDAEVHDEPAVEPRVRARRPPERDRGRDSPSARRRPRTPSTNWRTMPAVANAPSPYARTSARPRAPRTTATSIVSPPIHAGTSSRLPHHLAARRAPRQRGRHRHEEEQREADGRGHAVEVGLADRQPRAAQRLGDQREHRAEQHHERERREQQVVGEERRLARHRGVDAARRAQQRRRATR